MRVCSAWSAPETFRRVGGARISSAKSDVYMFGSLMFEVLVGNLPWFWMKPAELLAYRQVRACVYVCMFAC